MPARSTLVLSLVRVVERASLKALAHLTRSKLLKRGCSDLNDVVVDDRTAAAEVKIFGTRRRQRERWFRPRMILWGKNRHIGSRGFFKAPASHATPLRAAS